MSDQQPELSDVDKVCCCFDWFWNNNKYLLLLLLFGYLLGNRSVESSPKQSGYSTETNFTQKSK